MWMLRLCRHFEALKFAVIAGLTITVARQAINVRISLVRNIWFRTLLAKMALRYLQRYFWLKDSGDVALS
jgi:hypothetical protein